jgi:cytochrome c oxidase assembly protein subunit 15
MQTVALYDFSPVLILMLTGLALAMGPLAWIWLRHPKASGAQRLRVLTMVTLFLTFDLVLFGAFTRLSDSGLGCPDWPGCYGSASPLGAQLHIDAAQAAMPSGPVTHPKAWIEMIHRYLATTVGVLIVTLAIGTWFTRRRKSAESGTLSLWWPAATLLWVGLQGAFGALTVTMKLFPAIVTLHLLGGLVLLALLRAQSVAYAQRASPAGQRPRTLSAGLWWWVLASFAALWVLITLGGWVSTNYAVLACTDFPACQQSLWPDMDFSQGFTVWRSLGSGEGGGYISFQALTAIHYTHRLAAYVVFVLLLGLSIKLHRLPAFRQDARWLGGLILLQATTGISNVVLGWPLVAAVAHTGGAAALVVVMTGIIFSSRSQTVSRPVAAHASTSGIPRLTV